MKLKFLPFTLFLILAGLIYSCRKDSYHDEQAATPQLSVAEAKNWFEEQFPKISMAASTGATVSNNKVRTPFIGKPNWNAARKLELKGLAEVLKVPVYAFTDPAHPGFRDLLFAKGEDGLIRQIVMDIRPGLEYIKNKKRKGFKKGLANISNEDFTGDIVFFQLNKRLIGGLRYREGKITAKISPARKGKSSLGKSFSTISTDDPEGNMNDGFLLEEVTIKAVIESSASLYNYLFNIWEFPTATFSENSGYNQLFDYFIYNYNKYVGEYPGPETSTADHQLPNKHKLPPNGTTDTQVGNTCVFKTMEWISKYYGGNADVNSIMEAYRISNNLTQDNLLEVILVKGVDASELNGLLSLYFTHTSTDNLFTSIHNGHPVVGTILDPNNSENGHEVMITGYNDNGTMEYFDPQTGVYDQSKYANEFFNVREITGLKNP